MRTTFDQISLSLVDFLEAQTGVSNIDRVENPGATAVELNRWHEANRPYQLPPDLQNFYSLQNGLLLRWQMRFNGDMLPLGCLNINPLNKLEQRDVRDGSFLNAEREPVEIAAAFGLDNLCVDGRVVLAFRTEKEVLGVFFQDLSCQYFLVSDCFTNYLRLLFLHIGLPRWQYAFTISGLPQSAMQWSRQLIPRRLQLDLQMRESFQSNTSTTEKPKENTRCVTIDLDRIEKNARLIRTREASKKNHKKSTSDLPSVASNTPAQPSLVRPGSAPGRRQTTSQSLGFFQSRALVRPETGHRRQGRGPPT